MAENSGSRNNRRNGPARTRSTLRWVIVAIAIVAVCLMILVVPYAVARDRVPLFVTGDGAAMRLRTFEDARHVLERMSQMRQEESFLISAGGETTKVTYGETGISIDATRTFERMKKRYESGSWIASALRYGFMFFAPQEIELEVAFDEERFAAFFDRLARAWSVPPKNARLVIDKNGTASIEKSRNGTSIAPGALKRAIARGYLESARTVTIKKTTTLPSVTDEEASAALAEFETWKKKTLILKKNNESLVLEGESLARRLCAVEKNGKITIAVDPSRITALLNSYFADHGSEPVDARFDVSGDTVRIVPGKEGYMPDATETARASTNALAENMEATVEVIFSSREPSLTVERARAMGIKRQIGSYTTTYNPRQTNRVANIRLLAKLLDGQLIAPGEVFSFNERIGPRSLERGFKLAPTIVNGELVDTAGGGACQVGTTLFNCVFVSGLDVVERHNHSFYISHYPAGRDATVSYGGYDLRFRNDTKHWILIKAWASQSKITISFYGTPDGRRVEFQTGPFTNFKPYRTKYVDDPTLYVGQTVVEEEGISGRRITVRRQVYAADGTKLHDDVFVSVYRPKVEIVRRGTKPRPVESTTTVTTATP
jgi:vancomycin resistance protein YoaR